MTQKKSPNVKIASCANGKQCLMIGRSIKIVADKILRYAFLDNGRQIAILFKDEDNDNHLRGVNLMVVNTGAPIFKIVLLEPQPASESAEDAYFIGEKKNKTIIVHFRADTGKFYRLRTDSLEILGPFEERLAHPDSTYAHRQIK